MPSLAMFDKFDLLTSSDDDDSLGYTEIMESMTSSDYEDSPDSEAEKEISDAALHAPKTAYKKPPPAPGPEEEVGWPKPKARPTKANEESRFYDRNGDPKKRKKHTWKVTARKKFKGYLNGRRSKVPSTRSTTTATSNGDTNYLTKLRSRAR